MIEAKNSFAEAIVPLVVCTSMFAMIFGIVYLKSRENMALIEKGINPKQNGYRPRPFINLKWGLLLIGCGLGLLTAFIIDSFMPHHPKMITEKTIIRNCADTAKLNISKIDTAKTPGKHLVIIKDGKTTKIDENLERMDDIDVDTVNNATQHSVIIKGTHKSKDDDDDDNNNPAIYFALIAIGGGLGLFFSYKIEKKEWLDKNKAE